MIRRRRARQLYRGRRLALLEVPVAAMRAAGLEPVVGPEVDGARAELPDGSLLELGFAGTARVFGVMFDSVWSLRAPVGQEEPMHLEYRFRGARSGFRLVAGSSPRNGSSVLDRVLEGLAADRELHALVAGAEVRALSVQVQRDSTLIALRPVPGTITAMYLPPLPPSTVPLHSREARDHLRVLDRVCRHVAQQPTAPRY